MRGARCRRADRAQFIVGLIAVRHAHDAFAEFIFAAVRGHVRVGDDVISERAERPGKSQESDDHRRRPQRRQSVHGAVGVSVEIDPDIDTVFAHALRNLRRGQSADIDEMFAGRFYAVADIRSVARRRRVGENLEGFAIVPFEKTHDQITARMPAKFRRHVSDADASWFARCERRGFHVADADRRFASHVRGGDRAERRRAASGSPSHCVA